MLKKARLNAFLPTGKILGLCLILVFIFGSFTEINAKTTGEKERALLLQIKELALQGKILDCPFPLGTAINTVIEEWGQPDRTSTEDRIYDYDKQDILFHADPSQNVDTMLRGGTLSNITPADIKDVLGEPTEQDSGALVYELNNHQLWFSWAQPPYGVDPQIQIQLFN